MTTVENVDLHCLRGIGSRADTANLRIYAFHHAGGSASGYLWRKHFPDEIEVCAVQLPGRESRFLQAPITRMAAVVDELAPIIQSTVDLPFAFFGHSMGALIAFNVTRRLRASGAPLPRHLFVSAHRAPQLTNRDPIHGLPDEEFLARLGDSRLASLEPELREIFLPIVRADITICETYRHEPEAALPCPITALGGEEDHMVNEAELRAWEAHTASTFDLQMFPGGHFYLRGIEQLLADRMRRKLRGIS
jgi:medium-chain acyl-[acyl-carrier-protein] hydrolase